MKKISGSPLSTSLFYDDISEFYEKMIDFDKNLELRINAYSKIFSEKGKAADIGCGVGLDSLALALNGHDVSSFDISPKMIEETKRNALKYNVKLNAHVSSFSTIPKINNRKFNYFISVGNTIAHLDSVRLKSAINVMHRMLVPGGKIFLHILNYSLIMKENRRINNIASRDGRIIIRFYDFSKDNLDFNILSFPQNSPKEFQLVTTRHYPHSHGEIRNYLKEAGFNKIRFMKNFTGDKFNTGKSKDIFIEALKSL